MDTENYKLKQIPADRKLINDLYANKQITLEARNCALNFVYPTKQWKLWISRFLLTVGVIPKLTFKKGKH